MTPTTRISQLYADGHREDAVSLAREVLRNDRVDSVEFNREDDVVVVQTRYFEGRHPITGENEEGVVVDPHGEWWVRDEEGVDFTTFSLYDNVFEALENAERDQMTEDTEESADAQNQTGASAEQSRASENVGRDRSPENPGQDRRAPRS